MFVLMGRDAIPGSVFTSAKRADDIRPYNMQ